MHFCCVLFDDTGYYLNIERMETNMAKKTAKIIKSVNGQIVISGSKRTVTITRYCQAWGDSFSGWVARCDDGANYSDPQNRTDAIESAKGMADGLFGY